MTYKEWKITIDSIRLAIEKVVSTTGEEFFKVSEHKPIIIAKASTDHKPKKYGHLISPTPNPLIALWRKGYPNYQSLLQKQTHSFTKELLELFDLGNNLMEIESIALISKDGRKIKNSTRKMWRTRLTDSVSFEKAVYEIKVSSSLKRAGYQVCFIKEEKEKTPDMCVEKDGEKVYVECKQKDKKSQRDMRNQYLWDEILVNVLKALDNLGKNYAVVVKTDSDLTTADKDFLIEYIQTSIKNSKCGVFTANKFQIILKEFPKLNNVIDGHFKPDLREFNVNMHEPTLDIYHHSDENIKPSMDGFSFDWTNPVIDLYLERDNVSINAPEPKHKNPRLVVFVSSLLPDRIKGILNSFDHAYTQIPTEGPGIIYIEMNMGFYRDEKESARDLMLLENGLKGKLKLTKRVNAVILTTSAYFQEHEKAFYKVKIRSVKNTGPNKPLNQEFLGNICKMKIR